MEISVAGFLPRFSIIVVVLAAFPATQGCAIYKAATAPPPIAIENVQPGKSRSAIFGILGAPKLSENAAGKRTDIHEFVHGSNEASKARILLYIAGDLFTLALTELVFWPMELALGQGTPGRAVITYGADDIATDCAITKATGEPWETAKEYPHPKMKDLTEEKIRQ